MTLDLSPVPTWALAIAALVGWAAALAVIIRVVPPRDRARRWRLGGGGLAVLFVFQTAAGQREALWGGLVLATAIGLPMLAYPPLPDDLPPPGDPGRRQHPQYRDLERRGRRAGAIVIVCVVAGIAATVAFVHVG